jgi:hypothetical protein
MIFQIITCVLFTLSSAKIVEKTVFDSKLRFIHLIGLEGTGHHYFTKLHRDIFESNTNIYRINPWVFKHGDYSVPHLMNDVKNLGERNDLLRNKMKNLKELGDEHPGTFYSMSSEESFPWGGGPDKVLNYMDLRPFVEVAEEEKIDMRFIYLKRSAKDLIVSNTIHRGFHKSLSGRNNEEKFMHYIQIMLAEIAIVQSIMEEIDPAFIVCHDYDLIGDIDQSRKISKFVSPNEEVFRSYNESMVENTVHHSHSLSSPEIETLNYEMGAIEVIMSRLQSKLDSFEYKYC